MKKQRVHGEYFQPLVRKVCDCGQKTKVWAWGEYVAGRWRTVMHFCEHCFPSRVLGRLSAHAGECGCTFELRARAGSGPLPAWLTLNDASCAQAGPAPLQG